MGNALQSNEAWFQARRGKFTGSNFKYLVNKGRGKDFTEQGYSYIRKVVAERMGSYDFPSRSKACDWGNEHEAEAIEVYEENTGYVTDETGFVLHAEHDFAGCSVDGTIVDEGGIIEVKNPYNPANYIRYATDEAYILKEHGSQIYGNMWVMDAQFCDFIAYDRRNERKPIHIQRFHRDEEKIAKIQERVLLAEQVAVAMYNEILNPNCVEF